MKNIITLFLFLAPFISPGQNLSDVKAIDSAIREIENDPALVKKAFDTVRYVQEDGGEQWDSAYGHKEYYYRNGQVVKILAWNRKRQWRNDMVGYYLDGKVLSFSKGESYEGYPYYGELNFRIYYYDDKELKVTWLTPKPDNVAGVASDIFLIWAYSLFKERR